MASRLPVVIAAGQLQQLQAADALDAPFTSAKPGTVPLSGGGTVNFLRADGTWQPPGASGSALALSQHVIAADFTVTAGYSADVSRYIEIATGKTVEVGADGDLEIS